MKIFLKEFVKTEKFYILLIVLVAFVVMLPVLLKGLPFGYDLPHHYQCAITFYESILSGDFYPSWSLNRNFGFGGMESRLYPPISHYSLALAYLAIGDWHIASWLTFTFYTFVGCLGVYLWAKEYMPAAQAVFAGCLYALLPYHLNQLYNTFFYAEFVGSSVLPFTFVFVARVCKRGKFTDVLGLAISFAVLILTHLPLTVIGAICFSLYALTLLEREKIFAQIGKLALGVFGALGASSFFWIKVLMERDLMAKTLIYPDPWLDYSLHFLLTPIQTFEGELRTRIYETATFFYDLMFLYPLILVLACTIPFFIWERRSKNNMKGVWLILGISVFLAIPFSNFVWERLPLLQEVQFPWRWLAIICIVVPMIAASQINFLIQWFQDKKRRPAALIIAGCILAVITFSVSQIIRQAPFIEKETVNEYIATKGKEIGFTFWWTIWTRKEAFDVKEKVVADNRKVEIQNWTATDREFKITEGDATEARIATFYHPNWKATVNDVEIQIIPDENGAILIPISNTKSSVTLHFIEPFILKVGQWISVLIWIGFILIIVAGLRKKISFPARNKIISTDLETGRFEPALKFTKIAESNYRFLLLAGFCLLTILPTIFIGVYKGVDLPQHIQFSSTFYNSISSGNFYPSWAADENLGYGGIGVRFYPPLTPFLFALVKILVGNWHTATCLVFFLFTFVGAIGIYLLAKEFLTSNTECVFAAIIFIFMPYHLYQIQNGSQFAEFAACSIIPFTFLFVTRISRYGNFTDILGLAVSFAILILTHLPTTVIGSLSLLIYSLLSLSKGKSWSTLLKLFSAVALALLASSVYWLKIVTEMNWLRNTKLTDNNFYDYSYNFLLTADWFGEKQLWFINFIFLTLVIISALAVITLFLSNQTKKMRGIASILFFALFMCLVLSKPIWIIIPFLSEVQFPWRWLTIVSVCSPIVFVASYRSLANLSRTSSHWNNFTKGLAALIVICILGIFALMWSEFSLNHVDAKNYENYVAEKSDSLGGEWFWTIKTKEEVFNINEKVITDGRETEISSWQANERIFTVAEGNQTEARIATLFYPHWKSEVNGVSIQPQISGDGAILVSIPKEKANVKLWFEEPFQIIVAKYLSIFTWLFFGCAGVFSINFKFRYNKKTL
jgi:uncharacterized membrane protein